MNPLLSEISITIGQSLRLNFSSIAAGTHVEVQIRRVAVMNPEFAMSTGAPIEQDRSATVVLHMAQMQAGTFELVAARAITQLTQESSIPVEPTVHEVWRANSPQQRVLFEVAENARSVSEAQLRQEVLDAESRIEQEFLVPVQAVLGPSQPATRYFTALAFVRGMLIGSKLRFRNYEIVPSPEGIDDADTLLAVNRFLSQEARTGIQFPNSPERRQRSMQTNPVCVFHFPAVLARSHEEVKNYSLFENTPDSALISCISIRKIS